MKKQAMPILLMTTILTLCPLIDLVDAQITDRNWVQPTGGIFHFPFSWDSGVPFATDNAIFDLDQVTYTVELTGAAEVNSFQFRSGAITLSGGNSMTSITDSLIANQLTVTGSGTEVEVQGTLDFGISGLQPLPILTLEAGTVLRTELALPGVNPGTLANIFVGENAHWFTDNLVIGAEGAGLGVVVLAADSVLNVGSASPLAGEVRVGHDTSDGGATLEVYFGSILSLPSHNFGLGITTVHTGTALVSGEFSRILASNVEVGRLGNGILSIENQACLEAVDLSMATSTFSVSSASVTGLDSEMNLAGNAEIAVSGDATVLIDTEGVVTTEGDFSMAINAGSFASVEILNDGALEIGGNLIVGDGGVAQLITNGGVIDCENDVIVNEQSGLEVESGNLQLRGTLEVNGLTRLISANVINLFGPITLNGTGVLRTMDESASNFHSDIVNQGLEINTRPGSFSFFTQDYDGNNPFTGLGQVKFGNVYRSTGYTGATIFDGDVRFENNSILELEVAGLDTTEFDHLDIAGNLTLVGSLSTQFINGFIPIPGNQVLIARVDGTLTGTFDNLPQGALVAGLPGVDVRISYQANDGNDIALIGQPVDYGDANCDGNVNLLDVSPFVGLISNGEYLNKVDMNNDGAVNLLDVSLFVDVLSGN